MRTFSNMRCVWHFNSRATIRPQLQGRCVMRRLIAGMIGSVVLTITTTSVSVVDGAPVGRIAYSTYDETICVMDLPSGKVHLVPLPEMKARGEVRWSPDGQWLAFAGGTPLNVQIHVVHPDGTGYRQVTDGSGGLQHPSFSPDGTQITYNQVYGSLYTIDSGATLGNPAPTELPVRGAHPSWSPGSKIVYTNWGFTYDSDIFVYDPITGINTQVTHHQPGEAFNWASWSPDGTRLAVVRLDRNTGLCDVGILDPSDESFLNLTSDWSLSCENVPSWSRDATGQEYIVFMSNHTSNGNFDIFCMYPDGTHRENLTNTLDVGEIQPMLTHVPEPSTVVLLGAGAISLLAYVWRRRKQTA